MSEGTSSGFTIVTNKRAYLFLRWFVLLLFLTVLTDIVLSFLPGSLGDIAEGHYLALVSLGLLTLLFFLRINYFFYDDSYEVLHIRCKGLMFRGLGDDLNQRYDFPKRKVAKYHIRKRFLRRTLYLTLDNYASESRKVRQIDVSLMSEEDIDQLKLSLDSILDNNRKSGFLKD